MALYDLDGTAVGEANLDASLAVSMGLDESISGGSSVDWPVALNHLVTDPVSGIANVSASTEVVFNVSGFIVGQGDLIDGRLMSLAGIVTGSSVVTGDALTVLGVSGYIQASSSLDLSLPMPIVGSALVTAYMEVIHVPPPICETPQVQLAFRWGHTFTNGDLFLKTANYKGPFGPVCVSYTLYQMQRGCALKRIGPADRKPASDGVGSYYATGTAGECGQPGLWVVRWRYQRTFSDPVVEKDCYFRVLDSVSHPIPGDTLPRHCKYGWD